MGSSEERQRISFHRVARFYRVFGKHYLPYWKQFSIAMFGLLGGVLMALLSPWPLALMIDYVILHRPMPIQLVSILPWLRGNPEEALVVLAVLFVVFRILQHVFTFIDNYLVSVTGED